MSSWQNHGLTATLVDEHENLLTKVFGYTSYETHGRKAQGMSVWLNELVAYCDGHGLKVRCISTPQTILTDIKGRQPANKGPNGTVFLSEELTLGRTAGRPDLISRPPRRVQAERTPWSSNERRRS